ncbi:MAG: aldo/keto reductase [Deltaproteobacteria bacterium]|jgi:predicted aldo/keto reductase-like oxidoreductase|nr:aldo/keto reductase [Deltaproteobacteria bacterium]
MPYLGEEIQKLGFGFMRLPFIGDNVDITQTRVMVDLFMANGFSYFDTSWGYMGGKSEEALKTTVVERYPRNSFQIATKCPVFVVKTAEEAKAMIWTSLKRLGLDYVDFYLLHNLGGSRTQFFDDYGMWEYLRELKDKGVAKHIGFSMHDTAEALDNLLTAHPEVEFVQFQLNYDDWESPSIQARQCHAVAKKHQKPIVVMEPLKGGLLANPPESVRRVFEEANPKVSLASWGLRFAASQENIITVLSGMSTIDQMRDNVSFMANFKPIAPDEMPVIERARLAISKISSIPRTGCEYCLEGCPQNIPIPKVFGAYNRKLVYNDLEAAHMQYMVDVLNKDKAKDCVACEACEKVCPQRIGIVENLKLIAQHLDTLPSIFDD